MPFENHHAKQLKTVLIISVLLSLLLLAGCKTTLSSNPRPFHFGQDSMAFQNDLVWDYHYDAKGKWISERHQPKSDYTLHCFVVARSVKQFFENAQFDPGQQRADDETYSRLVHQVVKSPPVGAPEKIIIPGYSNLFTFSRDYEKLIKKEAGGAYQSYFQRGHWRMMLPFTRNQEKKMAEQLVADLEKNHPPLVHVVTFPHLKINHALILVGVQKSESGFIFSVYDPNNSQALQKLSFDSSKKRFEYQTTPYFQGGVVHIYEIYHSWNY